MGKSGVVCTKQGRKCVFNATCDNHRCKCPQGQRGQAEIECVNKGDNLCYIAADPHVTGFGHAKANVDLPCRFRASRFTTKHLGGVTEHSTCTFEVFATNELLHGRYVVRSVHISVGIMDPVLQAGTTIEIYKTVEYNVNDTEIYNYQARVVHRDVIWGSSNGKVDGVTIIPSFDEVNNFATLEIPDCETRIKYRAFDRFRAKHQKQLPGLTIQAPKHAEWIPGYGDYPASVCGTPSDTRSLYKDRADSLNLVDEDTAIIYDILADEPKQDDNRMAKRCNRAFQWFRTSNDQTGDLNACSFILSKPRVGRCIEEMNSLPIDIFNSCMALQQGVKWRCTRFRRAARQCGDLEDWTYPNAIECPRLIGSTTVPPKPETFVL